MCFVFFSWGKGLSGLSKKKRKKKKCCHNKKRHDHTIKVSTAILLSRNYLLYIIYIHNPTCIGFVRRRRKPHGISTKKKPTNNLVMGAHRAVADSYWSPRSPAKRRSLKMAMGRWRPFALRMVQWWLRFDVKKSPGWLKKCFTVAVHVCFINGFFGCGMVYPIYLQEFCFLIRPLNDFAQDLFKSL